MMSFIEVFIQISINFNHNQARNHWIIIGRSEGRFGTAPENYDSKLSKIFDWRHYLNVNPNLKDAITDKSAAWQHWVEIGQVEGRQYGHYRLIKEIIPELNITSTLLRLITP